MDPQKMDDLKFLGEILEKSRWLFYGDLDEYFQEFVCKVFEHEFSEYGFEKVPMESDFAVAYWLFLSELCALNLAEYGTSPRGAWLTPEGERFKKIILSDSQAIELANDYIYKSINGPQD